MSITAWAMQVPVANQFFHTSILHDMARILCHVHEDRLQPIIMHVPEPTVWQRAGAAWVKVVTWKHLLSPKANGIRLWLRMATNGNGSAAFRFSVKYASLWETTVDVTTTSATEDISLSDIRKNNDSEYLVLTCGVYLKEDAEVEVISAWEVKLV